MTSTNFELAIDEFFVPENQVIGITGRSGSGKTTFLYSLLGHTELVRGVVRQKDRMVLLSKEPLVIAGSLKENILMGAEFDPSRYYKAVNALKLNEDVILGTDSDEIPIGALELDREQLERVSLARALYSDRQIFLFDEPLASVQNVEKATLYFDQVVELMLQEKRTIVVATQNNQLLAKCQKIYFLDDGKIYKDGTYFEFMNVSMFTKMMKEYEIVRNSAG
jgi:ATP-binding cassette, subfamily C (CFTR/MRP), member 10